MRNEGSKKKVKEVSHKKGLFFLNGKKGRRLVSGFFFCQRQASEILSQSPSEISVTKTKKSDMPAAKDTSETAKKYKQAVNILSKNKPVSDNSLKLTQRYLVLKCQRQNGKKTCRWCRVADKKTEG